MNDNDTTDGPQPSDVDGSAEIETESDEPTENDESIDPTTSRGLADLQPMVWRAVRIVGLILLIALVLPFVAYAVPQVAGAEHSFVVLSGSMEPSISPGDVVLVAGVEPEAVEEGDVITYQRSEGESPTTHRVIEVDSGNDVQFRTKGDANEDPDQTAIAADQLIGRVTVTIPAIGHVITFVNTPVGFGLLVALPLVSFVLSEAWELRSKRRSDDSDEPEAAADSRSDGRVEPAENGIGGSRDGGATATESGGPTRSTEPAAASQSTDRYVVTKSDLLYSIGVLAVLVGYSGWATYTSFLRTGAPEVVSITVFTGSTTTLVLALAARSRLPDESELARTESNDSGPSTSADPDASDSDDAVEPDATRGESDDHDAATPEEIPRNGPSPSTFDWPDPDEPSEGTRTHSPEQTEADVPSPGTGTAVRGDAIDDGRPSGDTDDE
ncbi:signal peptidase I [Natrinema sp. CBA1119]|uniref:signal peptidase I n=1 Tax=Natrinema sp. CBA1119 TaxID=1608465 RepID=UPI000BF2AB15|nr:signal peptidase I [Natrinema sp. CBA1119]PGF17875.1 signal peptidase I [Natrinema sp. CBA1119]